MNVSILPTNFFLYLTCLFVAALLSAVTVSAKQLPGGLSSPQVGTICNEQTQICYDAYGVSIGITKDIMGQQAADRLTRELSTVDEKFFDRSNFNPAQGISCHILERSCYEWDTVSDLLSSALFGIDAGKYSHDALIGVSWVWDGSRYNNDTEILAMGSQAYRLHFEENGSAQIQADCNSVHSTYTASGKSLSFMIGPSTMMACGMDSQDRYFLRDLEGVVDWFLEKGILYLDIKFDTGTMSFYRGVGMVFGKSSRIPPPTSPGWIRQYLRAGSINGFRMQQG